MDISDIREFVKEEILYCCIVGSRMYGLESLESDYDIVVVTKPDLREALSPFKEMRIKEIKSGNLDIKIIPIQKFFYFLAKQNPNFIEYLYSNKIIKDFEYREETRMKIEENFNPMKFYLHYLTLALRNFRENMIGKTTLLVIRSLLSARFVLDFEKIPPVNFWNLLKTVNFFKEEEIKELLDKREEKVGNEIIDKVKKLISELPPIYPKPVSHSDLIDFFEDLLVRIYAKGSK